MTTRVNVLKELVRDSKYTVDVRAVAQAIVAKIEQPLTAFPGRRQSGRPD